MITYKNYCHQMESVSLALKNMEINLRIAENALKQARENREFARDIIDSVNKDFLPFLKGSLDGEYTEQNH